MAADADAGLAGWAKDAEAWLDRAGACVAGTLGPQQVAALAQEHAQLRGDLAERRKRLRAQGAVPPPLRFDGLLHRLAAEQIPALGDRILLHFPAPGEVGLGAPAEAASFNLPAAIDLLALLEQACGDLFLRPAERARRHRLCRQLRALGQRYHRRVMDGFAVLEALPDDGGEAIPAPAPADRVAAARDSVRDANYDQIRMELLQWVLEALHDRQGAAEVRHLSQITARTAVRRVDLDLQGYLASHEPATRVRLRPVLESVDEVLALLRAVLQQSQEAEAEGGIRYFVRDLGADAAEPFIRHMGLLVIALFEDLQFAAARCRLRPAPLRGALQRIDEVLTFCRLVEHPLGRESHARALRVIRGRSDALTADLERCMRQSGAADGGEARAALLVLREFVERRCAEG